MTQWPISLTFILFFRRHNSTPWWPDLQRSSLSCQVILSPGEVTDPLFRSRTMLTNYCRIIKFTVYLTDFQYLLWQRLVPFVNCVSWAKWTISSYVVAMFWSSYANWVRSNSTRSQLSYRKTLCFLCVDEQHFVLPQIWSIPWHSLLKGQHLVSSVRLCISLSLESRELCMYFRWNLRNNKEVCVIWTVCSLRAPFTLTYDITISYCRYVNVVPVTGLVFLGSRPILMIYYPGHPVAVASDSPRYSFLCTSSDPFACDIGLVCGSEGHRLWFSNNCWPNNVSEYLELRFNTLRCKAQSTKSLITTLFVTYDCFPDKTWNIYCFYKKVCKTLDHWLTICRFRLSCGLTRELVAGIRDLSQALSCAFPHPASSEVHYSAYALPWRGYSYK